MFCCILPLDRDESLEVYVGDVTSYTLHNLLPGTTYDVQVFAQYDGGVSKPLMGQGTTCTFSEVWFYATVFNASKIPNFPSCPFSVPQCDQP